MKYVEFLLIFFNKLILLFLFLIQKMVEFLFMWHICLLELFLKLEIFVFETCSAIFYFIELLLLSRMEVIAYLIVVHFYCTILFVNNFHLIFQLSIFAFQLFILSFYRLLFLLNFEEIFIKFLQRLINLLLF